MAELRPPGWAMPAEKAEVAPVIECACAGPPGEAHESCAGNEVVSRLRADFPDFAVFRQWDAVRGLVFIAIRVRGHSSVMVVMTQGEAGMRALLGVAADDESRAVTGTALGAPG